MQYKSTRNAKNITTASKAIVEGLANDGGLYVPVSIPKLNDNWEELKAYSYQEMAFYILKVFLSDFEPVALKQCIELAYDDKFDDPMIAPLKQANGRYYLELFHGSTIAFKDMALSLLPHLIKTAAKMNNNDNDIVILTATSGDTGKAAMAGFADVEGTEIIVFYPDGGVSTIQERQMLTQIGSNTHVIAVKGNFDDAQSKVKELFNDQHFKEELASVGKQFSSANSMNIGRLVPQIVYYYYSYAQLVRSGAIQAGDLIDFCVPTGNFGNILAGYYAKRLGLPINQLICASNDNTVLYDFFETGIYNINRDFILTISPSMDILISSNFERLLYHALGDDTTELIKLMEDLQLLGQYQVDDATRQNFNEFIAGFATEGETKEEIRDCYQTSDYVIDPHTAVASKVITKLEKEASLSHPTVILATASPYKFPQAVLEALGVNVTDLTDQEQLEMIKKYSQVEFPPAIKELFMLATRDRTVVAIDEMKDTVKDIIIK